MYVSSCSIFVSNLNSLSTVAWEDFVSQIPIFKGINEKNQLWCIKGISEYRYRAAERLPMFLLPPPSSPNLPPERTEYFRLTPVALRNVRGEHCCRVRRREIPCGKIPRDVPSRDPDNVVRNLTAPSVRFAGVISGFIVMGVAFIVAQSSGVIDASQLMTSATSGPLLGVFVLAMFFPSTNWKVSRRLTTRFFAGASVVILPGSAAGFAPRIAGHTAIRQRAGLVRV